MASAIALKQIDKHQYSSTSISKIQLQPKSLISPPVLRWPGPHKWMGHGPIGDTIPAGRDSPKNIMLPGALWSQSISFLVQSNFLHLHDGLPAKPSAEVIYPIIFNLKFLVVFYLSHLYFSWAKAAVLQV